MTSVQKIRRVNSVTSICTKFPSMPVILDNTCYNLVHETQLCGVFGKINIIYLNEIKKHAIQKIVSMDITTETEVIAEAKIMHMVSGHPLFPYCFGFERPNIIISEFLGTFENGECVVSTVRNVLGKSMISKFHWITITDQIVEGIMFLHSLTILHNDIKSDNVILIGPALTKVKIIDFGKCSLISNPVVYNLSTSSTEKYNKFHSTLR